MSVSRSDGLSSSCPPLCQLLGALCYTPALCSVSHRLPPQRGGPQAVLGALWIITGVLHIGLDSVVIYTGGSLSERLQSMYCPVWLGGLFMVLGLGCILTERYPRPLFVLLSGILNLYGAAMSFTGLVWYASLFDKVGVYDLCWTEDYDYWSPPMATLSPEEQPVMEVCEEARLMLRSFSISISISLFTLSVLDVCVGLSSAIISFKSLKQ